MSAKQPQKGLGRSFGSLLPEGFDQSILLDKQDRVQKLFINEIQPDPKQPRKHFDETALSELGSSIKRYGILQPLVVSPHGDKYTIIAGERRFRAAKMAGLKQVPAIVRTSEELERTEIGLVENVQRVDLSPIEQAVSIVKLHEQFNVSYGDIAKRLGKAQTTIINTARLLGLPDKARQALEEAKITEGHARAVLALKNQPARQDELLEAIIKNGWSVRQAEQFVNSQKPAGQAKKRGSSSQTSTEAHEQLSQKLGAETTIVRTKKGGRIVVSFKDDQQLQEIIDKLT